MNWDSLKEGLTKFGVLQEEAHPVQTGPVSLRQNHPNLHSTGAIIVTDDIDGHFVAALRDTASKSKVPGYEQFEDQLKALEGEESDEAKRIRLAARTTTAAHHITPQQIVDSLRDRMRLLDDEYSETEDGFAKQADTQVDAKQAAIKAIESQIALKQQEIDDLRKKKQLAETEVLTFKQKLDTTKTKFESAYKVVKAEYEGVLSKLSAILK